MQSPTLFSCMNRPTIGLRRAHGAACLANARAASSAPQAATNHKFLNAASAVPDWLMPARPGATSATSLLLGALSPAAHSRALRLTRSAAHILICTMHLMYYLDAQGSRVYTVKVRQQCRSCNACALGTTRSPPFLRPHPPLFLRPHHLPPFEQKFDPSGKPTRSAHPGAHHLCTPWAWPKPR